MIGPVSCAELIVVKLANASCWLLSLRAFSKLKIPKIGRGCSFFDLDFLSMRAQRIIAMNKTENSRWSLVRAGLIFQVKLGLDAGRDLLLSPVSIVFIAIDLLRGKSQQRGLFHRLMRFGHSTDNWINLFGNPKELEGTDDDEKLNVDRLFSQIEQLLKDGHGEGGLTASAKSSIDRYLNSLMKKDASLDGDNSGESTRKIDAQER